MESSKKDYTIRQYRPGDEEKIVKLLIDVFQPWPKFDIECSPIDHWRWKFIDDPANKGTYAHTVAALNGEIIGVDHAMLYYIKIGEGRYLSQKGGDTAVNPNYRGQGIYSKLTKLKHEVVNELGYEFDYALSNNPIFVKSGERKRVNRDPEAEALFPHPLKSLIKINDVNKYFQYAVDEKDPWKKMFLKMGVYGAKFLNKITNLNPRPTKTDVKIREITKFDDRINTFYEKIKPQYYFIVEKTAEYLNWRYCDKRGGNFKTWIAEEAGEIVGFMVLRVNRINPEYPLGYVIDLLALDGRLDIVESFVSFAVGWFDGLSVNVVHTQLIGNHVYEGILGKYGFLDSRVKPHLTYRPWNVSAKDLELFRGASPSELHYPYGEGDAI